MSRLQDYPHLTIEPVVAWLTHNFQHDIEDTVEVDGVQRITNARIAELCGVGRTQVTQWRSTGLPWDTADRIAVHLGLVPALLWPQYDEEPIHLIDTIHRSRSLTSARRAIKRGRPIEHLCDERQIAEAG